MNEIILEIQAIFIICLTHGIYIEKINKIQKTIAISVPSSSCQKLYGEELAIQFKDYFISIFEGYRVLFVNRNEYWSTEDSERYFESNIDMILNELDRIKKEQG